MELKKVIRIHASYLTHHIGFWMRLVSNHVSYAFARKLEAHDVTVAEWVVLREMYTHDDRTSPSHVAKLTGLTRGAVSKLIARLLGKNLVTREESSDDRRYQDIGLTKAATVLIPKLAKLADKNDEEFFHLLTKSDRTALIEILKKMAELHKLKKMPVE